MSASQTQNAIFLLRVQDRGLQHGNIFWEQQCVCIAYDEDAMVPGEQGVFLTSGAACGRSFPEFVTLTVSDAAYPEFEMEAGNMKNVDKEIVREIRTAEEKNWESAPEASADLMETLLEQVELAHPEDEEEEDDAFSSMFASSRGGGYSSASDGGASMSSQGSRASTGSRRSQRSRRSRSRRRRRRRRRQQTSRQANASRGGGSLTAGTQANEGLEDDEYGADLDGENSIEIAGGERVRTADPDAEQMAALRAKLNQRWTVAECACSVDQNPQGDDESLVGGGQGSGGAPPPAMMMSRQDTGMPFSKEALYPWYHDSDYATEEEEEDKKAADGGGEEGDSDNSSDEEKGKRAEEEAAAAAKDALQAELFGDGDEGELNIGALRHLLGIPPDIAQGPAKEFRAFKRHEANTLVVLFPDYSAMGAENDDEDGDRNDKECDSADEEHDDESNSHSYSHSSRSRSRKYTAFSLDSQSSAFQAMLLQRAMSLLPTRELAFDDKVFFFLQPWAGCEPIRVMGTVKRVSDWSFTFKMDPIQHEEYKIPASAPLFAVIGEDEDDEEFLEKEEKFTGKPVALDHESIKSLLSASVTDRRRWCLVGFYKFPNRKRQFCHEAVRISPPRAHHVVQNTSMYMSKYTCSVAPSHEEDDDENKQLVLRRLKAREARTKAREATPAELLPSQGGGEHAEEQQLLQEEPSYQSMQSSLTQTQHTLLQSTTMSTGGLAAASAFSTGTEGANEAAMAVAMAAEYFTIDTAMGVLVSAQDLARFTLEHDAEEMDKKQRHQAAKLEQSYYDSGKDADDTDDTDRVAEQKEASSAEDGAAAKSVRGDEDGGGGDLLSVSNTSHASARSAASSVSAVSLSWRLPEPSLSAPSREENLMYDRPSSGASGMSDSAPPTDDILSSLMTLAASRQAAIHPAAAQMGHASVAMGRMVSEHKVNWADLEAKGFLNIVACFHELQQALNHWNQAFSDLWLAEERANKSTDDDMQEEDEDARSMNSGYASAFSLSSATTTASSVTSVASSTVTGQQSQASGTHRGKGRPALVAPAPVSFGRSTAVGLCRVISSTVHSSSASRKCVDCGAITILREAANTCVQKLPAKEEDSMWLLSTTLSLLMCKKGKAELAADETLLRNIGRCLRGPRDRLHKTLSYHVSAFTMLVELGVDQNIRDEYGERPHMLERAPVWLLWRSYIEDVIKKGYPQKSPELHMLVQWVWPESRRNVRSKAGLLLEAPSSSDHDTR